MLDAIDKLDTLISNIQRTISTAHESRKVQLDQFLSGTVSARSTLIGSMPGVYQRFIPTCAFCWQMVYEQCDFYPSHMPSSRCQSGGHAHCTCDTCF